MYVKENGKYKCCSEYVYKVDYLVIKFSCDLEFDKEAQITTHIADHWLKAVKEKYECSRCKLEGKVMFGQKSMEKDRSSIFI